jgi:outer membrane protein W
MKTNKLFALIAIAGLTLGVNTAKAQISVSGYGGLALPMGDMASEDKGNLKLGFGGGLAGRYWLNDNMAVGINFDWYGNGGNDVPSGLTAKALTSSYMAAFDYYFMDEGFKPYVGLQLGYLATTYTITGDFMGVPFDVSETAGGFGLAPVIGAAYGINDNLDIFMNLKYVIGMNKTDAMDINTTMLPINIGITYKFGN